MVAATTQTPTPAKAPTTTPTPSAGARASGAGSGGDLKRQLRQADFATGEALLAPSPTGAAVQAKTDPAAVAGADDEATCDPESWDTTQDAGDFSTYGAAMHAIGSALDLAAPRPGTSAEINFSASVTASGVYAKLGLKASVSRTDAGMSVSATVSGSIGVGSQAGTSQMTAALKLAATKTANGDSGAECMDLIGLHTYDFLSSQPDSVWEWLVQTGPSVMRASGLGKLAADALWGADFPASVLAAMDPASAGDEADTVSGTNTIGLEAEAKDTELKSGASGEVTGSETTTIGKGASGGMTKTKTHSAAVSIVISALGCSGTVSFDSTKGLTVSVEVPAPKGGGAAQACYLTFAKVVEDAIRQVVSSGAVDGPTGTRMVEALVSAPQSAITMGLEEAGAMSGSLTFEATFGLSGAVGLTVNRGSKAEIEKSLGGGVGGGAVTGSITTQTAIVTYP